MDPIVRNCGTDDSRDLARLAGQLGYPCSEDEVRKRMGHFIGAIDRTILVADLDGKIAGWASLEVVEHFYLEAYVQVTGLVVDEAERRKGIGRLLLSRAEEWAKARGHALLRLQTNSVRTDAHHFYESLGFEKRKEQFVYVKRLRGERSAKTASV